MRLTLLGVAMALAVAAARADMAAPPAIPVRAAQAQVIVVGKVTSIEDATVKAAPLWGGDKVDHKVAVVKIEKLLQGEKGLTHVKVGFVPPAPGVTRRPTVRLAVGQEVCLFLVKHPQEAFHVAPMYFDVIDKQHTQNFDKEVALAKRCCGLLADPDAGLKSKEAADRTLTAALLIHQYRQKPFYVPGEVKWEPIEAAQSRRILETLAQADWGRPDAALGYEMAPQYLFDRLGLTGDDGWTPPADGGNLAAAARKWLKENAGKYRIKRWQAGKSEK
jgi:hypothetical protein